MLDVKSGDYWTRKKKGCLPLHVNLHHQLSESISLLCRLKTELKDHELVVQQHSTSAPSTSDPANVTVLMSQAAQEKTEAETLSRSDFKEK